MISNRPRITAVSFLIICLLVANGCSSGVVKSFAAMNAIRQHLIQRYHDDVNVNIQNSRFLRIVFVNSALNQADADKRSARANDAARFVARNYEDINGIEQIWIVFIASKTKLIAFHSDQVIQWFDFDRNGVSLGNASSEMRAPVVRYIASTNQTDISVTRIQLDGDIKKGVALVPHFLISGDARQPPNQLAPPDSVTFDFASYSDGPIFVDNAPLEIDCDGRPTLKGTARLQPSEASGADETIAQFLTVRMSFKAFERIAHSRNVTIKLEPKRFELGPDDIAAFAQMTTYAGSSSGGER
jgi:hypothetical protein